MEPNTKLFPAVFVLPTHQNVIQFELGKQKVRVQRWGRPREQGRELRPAEWLTSGAVREVSLEAEWQDRAGRES